MANTTLLKPTTVEAVVDEKNPNLAVITLEPFERGYGHTLGNALRRILLSSMVGYAPTEASIVGVVHEYSQIDGVIEDVVDILLNLKGVVFKLEGGRQDVNLRLQKSGNGVVTAGDFELPHDVQVLNPDHVICNLSGGKLDMQVHVEAGRGQQQRVLPEPGGGVDGAGLIDALDARGADEQLAGEPAGLDARQHARQVAAQLHAFAHQRQAAIVAHQADGGVVDGGKHVVVEGHGEASDRRVLGEFGAVGLGLSRTRGFARLGFSEVPRGRERECSLSPGVLSERFGAARRAAPVPRVASLGVRAWR